MASAERKRRAESKRVGGGGDPGREGRKAVARTSASELSREGGRCGGAVVGRSVVLMRSLPDGLNEPQLRRFFSQFGSITRLRLLRSLKTGGSKHTAFVEFENPKVADIVAETMNGYVLFGRTLRCAVLAPENVLPTTFRQFRHHESGRRGRRVFVIDWNRRKAKRLNKPNLLVPEEVLREQGIDLSLLKEVRCPMSGEREGGDVPLEEGVDRSLGPHDVSRTSTGEEEGGVEDPTEEAERRRKKKDRVVFQMFRKEVVESARRREEKVRRRLKKAGIDYDFKGIGSPEASAARTARRKKSTVLTSTSSSSSSSLALESGAADKARRKSKRKHSKHQTEEEAARPPCLAIKKKTTNKKARESRDLV